MYGNNLHLQITQYCKIKMSNNSAIREFEEIRKSSFFRL